MQCQQTLSIDLDGNDYHFLEFILTHIKPMVISVEYNSKFPPPFKKVMPYNENHVWQHDDYFGASLSAFVDLLKEYKLVSCNISGWNAFFVAKRFATLFTDYTEDQLYLPNYAGYTALTSGHKPSMKWLRDSLNADR